MRLSPRSILFLSAVAAAGAACAGSSGSGGSTTTSTSGTTSASTGGSTSSSTSTSTNTTSTSTTTTTTTTTPYACAGSQDVAILSGTLTWPAEMDCSGPDAGAAQDAGAVEACLAAATGLTPACAACIAEDLVCSRQCQSACAGGPASQDCVSCRDANCVTAFGVCSGLTGETGSLSCASMYGDGPSSTSLVTGRWETYFTTAAGYAAYQSYVDCACNTTCAPDCQPDYCGGNQVARPPCVSCVQQQCAAAVATCQAN